jgi:hypothetical protein
MPASPEGSDGVVAFIILGGRFGSEQVAGLNQNTWPDSSEYADTRLLAAGRFIIVSAEELE